MLVASKFAGGSIGINAFVLIRVHFYIVKKSENSLDMDELTFHAEKTAIAATNQSVFFSFSATKYSLKLHETRQ